ncbi:DUF58 domain-containing protein [Gammaproteobacteria bacterium]|nr:DUF58 domain-containing protein [Gammaproteobacteria bacterium]
MSRKRQLNIQQDQYRSKGAFIGLQQLLEQRHAAKSLELDYQSRSRLGMAGSHISKTKGRGVDFEEYRAYQAGDDIRSIDWRVTARTGRPFTKIFREERERPVIIGVDQSHNMFFGSKVAFKSVIAAEAAAIICWTTVDNGDRVGGVVFTDDKQDLIKPRRSKRSALRFLNTLSDYNQALLHSHKSASPNKPCLRAALEQIYRITKPGSTVYLISDFEGFDDTCKLYLQQLALHNSVTCLFVYDALEENLPLPGVYSITDGEHRSSINTHARSVREHYHQAFINRLEMLSEEFTNMKIPLISLRTDQRVLEQLEIWNHKTC